jgi:hypothetical protein
MPSQSGTSRLRTSRGIAAVCVLLAYLLAGALHGLCHCDIVATPASAATVMSIAETTDSHHSGKALADDHHCHGCFSVAVPAPATLATRTEPVKSRPLPPQTHVAGLSPNIDTPPPKHLT